MKIKFLGAAGTVTGSSYALTSAAGRTILIDLGMFQGPKEVDNLNYLPYDFDPRNYVGAILTHAHLDHCGRLPILTNTNFDQDIYMTPPTRDLAELTLLDSAKVAVQDKKKALYDAEKVYDLLKLFKTVDYHKPFMVGDFEVTFYDAGHIVGSASLEIIDTTASDSPAKDTIRKIIFSGDLGNSPEDLVQATEFLSDAEAVVMESTYGDRLHPQESAIDILQAEINTIEQTGNTLLIPAFALERTQEILHMIMHLKLDRKIRQDTPVYLDSPMAERATLIYVDHPEVFNDHIRADIDEEGSAFAFPGLDIISKRSGSMNLHKHMGSQVIIAGSGMMTGGRILSHAAHYLPNPHSRLLIVGYQGEGTVGRELLEGSKEVTIDHQQIVVRATITATHALSSHADQGQLLEWLGHIKGVQKVFLTHGEDGPRKALKAKITEKLGISHIVLPTLNEEIAV